MASAGEKALHSALKKRVFDPVYYLFGEDDFLKEQATRDLIEAAVDPATRDFNLELRRAGELDAEALDALLSTPPMLAERRVVVLRDVDKMKKSVRTLLDRYLARPAHDTVLVLVAPSGAKSDKTLSDRTTAVEYAPLFQRQSSGLPTNTVPAFRVGHDGALWFGTALGLSRMPIREAILRLVSEGLVETAANRWTRVTPLDATAAPPFAV